MGSRTYYLGIFLGILYTIVTIVILLLYLHYGIDYFALPSYLSWYNLSYSIFFLWIFVLLIYHHHRGHKAAFVSCLFMLIASGFHWYVFLRSFLYGEFISFYYPLYFIALGSALPYALSLVFSVTGKIKLLKRTGIFSAVAAILQIITFIGYLNTKGALLKSTFEEWHNNLSLGSTLVILLLAKNLWNELQKEKTKQEQSALSKFLDIPILFATVLVVAFSFYLGKKTTYEKPVKSSENVATTKDKASAQRFEAGLFINKQNDSLSYRLLKPLNYDSLKVYPMVICLHGGAGWGTDNVKQVNGSLPAVMLSNYLTREQHPAFLFVPQISSAYSFGGLPNLKVADDIILEAIQSLDSRFKIDKSRLYIAGNSLGAYSVWHFIGKYPDTFAAAIPISGEGDIDKAPEMINTAVWAFHGKKDINVPVSGSREMIEAIRLAGGNPLYTEYPDADHDIWKKVINTPGLVDWLFSKQKNNPHK